MKKCYQRPTLVLLAKTGLVDGLPSFDPAMLYIFMFYLCVAPLASTLPLRSQRDPLPRQFQARHLGDTTAAVHAVVPIFKEAR